MMGWDEDFLQDAVNTCTNESGRIEDCPLFDVVDQATAAQCSLTLPQALSAEDVDGPVSALPGNVEITYGDGSTDGDDEPAPTTATVQPTLTYQPGETPSAPASPLPGQVFKETSAYVAPVPTTTSTSTTSTSTSSVPTELGDFGALDVSETTAPEPTTTVPAATTTAVPAPEESVSYFSTQYVTAGNVVSKILWEEEVIYVTEFEETTTTVVVQPSAVPARRRRGAHLHGHGHNRL